MTKVRAFLGSIHLPDVGFLGGKAKKQWDPKRVQRLKEFRENLHIRVGSKYEGLWSLEVGANGKGRATEAQPEKKKRKGKKERAKLRAVLGENDGESDEEDQPEPAGKPQKRKRESDVGSQPPASHPDETGMNGEDGTRKKRRRRHKKASTSGVGAAAVP